MDLSSLRRAIPAAIDALGGDSRVSALGDDAWAIFRGSAVGYVTLVADRNVNIDAVRTALGRSVDRLRGTWRTSGAA